MEAGLGFDFEFGRIRHLLLMTFMDISVDITCIDLESS